VFTASGRDVLDVHDKAKQATAYAREFGRPCILVFSDIPRRFGHAATDRQSAYLTEVEIQEAADTNVLEGLCATAVEANATTYSALADLYEDITRQTQDAFGKAANEPKITSRDAMVDVLSAPLVAVPGVEGATDGNADADGGETRKPGRGVVMRKAMNKVIAECLDQHPECVYLGEDVQHGGYYIVTEGLSDKFPMRVRDFPPDETTLLGAAQGYSQAGMVPIVEIPYSKYLDCGADTFFEIALSHWLSKGDQPNGMIIRLQGFDSGVFGGNFHTHNSLHMPPGIDVVCYSNGADYVDGWRYAIHQAKAGRVVMSVDCTALLNQRHVLPGDNAWLKPVPALGSAMSFGEVKVYENGSTTAAIATASGTGTNGTAAAGAKLAIVSYGNGIPLALQAADLLHQQEHSGFGPGDIVVIDTPLISSVPSGLVDALNDRGFSSVLFADICKQGQNPYSGMVTELQSGGNLPPSWECVAAPRTYNPLGNMVTFLSVGDIVQAAGRLCSK
jgi:2-oxoisovalerate dehydrogenase E1 component